MALLFMDGFDVGDFALKGWITNGAFASSTTRFSLGKSLQMDSASWTASLSFAATSSLFVGFAFNCTTNMSAQILFLKGDNGATSHLTLTRNIDGTFTLTRGATTLGVSPVVQVGGGWVYVEMWATIADSGGRAVVKINGVTVIDFTGDTKNAGTNTTLDNLTFGAASASSTWFDDVYICNAVGSVNNTFLGDVRVQTLMPTGAGTSTQFTPSVGSNWDNVNDIPAVTTTYNASSTVGQRDTYAMGDLLAGTGTIFGVQGTIQAVKSDAGVASLKAAVKSGVSVYYDGTWALGASIASSSVIREADPATSAPWTTTNVNALEFGAEVA